MNRNCSVFRTSKFIGKKWTLLILLELYKRDNKWKRYSQVKRKLSEITPKVLSMRLKELEREGLIEKRVDAKSFPIKSEYSLTNNGKDFMRIIKDMKDWSLKWKGRNKFCEKEDCNNCDCRYCEL